jgi:hypothetical protein
MTSVKIQGEGVDSFPIIVEWSDGAQEFYIRGVKADGTPSNVGIYLKKQGGGVVYNRGQIDSNLNGDPFLLDGDDRIKNIGTP